MYLERRINVTYSRLGLNRKCLNVMKSLRYYTGKFISSFSTKLIPIWVGTLGVVKPIWNGKLCLNLLGAIIISLITDAIKNELANEGGMFLNQNHLYFHQHGVPL